MNCIYCGNDLGKLKRKTCSDDCLSKYRSETSTRVNKQHKTNDAIFAKREKRSRLRFDEEMEKREIESLLNEYR